jgi:hypothetical protein
MMSTRPIARAIIAIAAIAGAAYAQTTDTAQLKINNLVGLDSTYSQAVKAFGKPQRETRPVREECAGGHEKTVNYPGLSFYFMDAVDPGKNAYLVVSFDVTSPRYSVSGAKVGDSQATIRQRFGKPTSVETDKRSGQTTWAYEIGERLGPGQTTVTFKHGRVTVIGSAFMVC